MEQNNNSNFNQHYSKHSGLMDDIILEPSAENLAKGIVGAAIGSIIGAAVWFIFAFYTNKEIPFLGIVLGFFTGLGMQYLGKSTQPKFGIYAVVVSTMGCSLGTFLAHVAVYMKTQNLAISSLFNQDLSQILLISAESVLDFWYLLVWIIAGILAYFFSSTEMKAKYIFDIF